MKRSTGQVTHSQTAPTSRTPEGSHQFLSPWFAMEGFSQLGREVLIRTHQPGAGDGFLWPLTAPGGTCTPLFSQTGLIFPPPCLIPENQGGGKRTLVTETSHMRWWQPNPFCHIPLCPIWVPWTQQCHQGLGRDFPAGILGGSKPMCKF